MLGIEKCGETRRAQPAKSLQAAKKSGARSVIYPDMLRIQATPQPEQSDRMSIVVLSLAIIVICLIA
jgi:hypothetical protein